MRWGGRRRPLCGSRFEDVTQVLRRSQPCEDLGDFQCKGPGAGKGVAFSKNKKGPDDWSTLSEGQSGVRWDWREGLSSESL